MFQSQIWPVDERDLRIYVLVPMASSTNKPVILEALVTDRAMSRANSENFQEFLLLLQRWFTINCKCPFLFFFCIYPSCLSGGLLQRSHMLDVVGHRAHTNKKWKSQPILKSIPKFLVMNWETRPCEPSAEYVSCSNQTTNASHTTHSNIPISYI